MRFKKFLSSNVFVRVSVFIITLMLTVGDPLFLIHLITQRHAPTLFSIKSAHADAVIEPLPEVSGDLAGYIAGNFSVSERGTANYSIPITVPAGTGGIQPQLSLDYDSRGGNGLLGVGWNLGGLSTITRCPTTMYQDGLIDGVDFDDNDKLCLDGQRLVVVQGNYGAANSEYRTENETFQKIVASSAMAANTNRPQSFTSKTKSGLIYEYALTADSRVQAQGTDHVLLWRVNKIKDSSGNNMLITYFEDPYEGESYPIRISYTQNIPQGLGSYNSVEFIYEDRPDVNKAYVSGSKVTTSKRLKEIEILYQDNLVREYVFDYEVGVQTFDSRLKSITECDNQGVCLNPTTFDYSDSTITFKTPTKWIQSGEAGYPPTSTGNVVHDSFGDFNGDGKTDKLWLKNTNGEIFIALSTGNDYVISQWVAQDSSGGNVDPFTSVANGDFERVVDFNGDGLSDRGWRVGTAEATDDYVVALSNGNGFEPVEIWVDGVANGSIPQWGPSDENRFHEHYGDINGDGRMDRVYQVYPWSHPGEVWVMVSTGVGFEDPQMWIPREEAPSGGKLYSDHGKYEAVVDLNGDGLADYAFIPRGREDFFVSYSNGSDFSTPELLIPANFAGGLSTFSYAGWHWEFVDLNGDGLVDYKWVPHNGGANGQNIWVSINNGNGFNPATIWFPDGGLDGFDPISTEGTHEQMTDINGDGLTDLLIVPKDSEDLYVLYSNGSAFVNPQILLSNFQDGSDTIKTFASHANKEAAADFNGDGLADWGWIPNGKSDFWVALNEGIKPNLLTKVTNGHGKEIKLEYKPLTDDSIYQKHTDADYPIIDIKSPIYVVSAYEECNGLGGFSRMSYFYRGLKASLDGKGFCGFYYIRTKNEQTGTSTTNFYLQAFPYKTMLRRSATRLADNTLIHEVDHVYNVQNFSPGLRYHPYINETVETNYDLDGSLIKSMTTHYTPGDFGNISNIDVTYSDGYTESTVNTYVNDQTNWYLGRLTRAEVTKQAPGQPAVTRTSAFEYDANTGLLKTEIIEPDNLISKLQKDYTRDGFGNIRFSTTSGPTFETRTNETQYSPDGRFVETSINALGHQATKTYNQALGTLESSTDVNNLTTHYAYDSFDRLNHVTTPLGTEERTVYFLADANSPANAAYYIRIDASGSVPQITYYDVLDREIRKETIGFNGQKIFSDTEYNNLGQVHRKSEPYFENDTPQWTVYTYDILSRVINIVAPGNRVASTVYNGLTTVTTNPLNQTKTTTDNERGKVVSSIDNDNNEITYKYDSFGHLIELRDPQDNVTSMTYDIRGNKMTITEPNSGTTLYSYNGLGQQTSQTDAKGQTVSLEYDILGRMTHRTENEGVTAWSYDSAVNALGLLDSVTAPEGFSETYLYDTFGRLQSTRTLFDNQAFDRQQTYDIYGRVENNIYPSGFGVSNVYNSLGYLSEIHRLDTGALIWTQDIVNARGQIEQQTLGNGLVTRNNFDNDTGFLTKIETGLNGGFEFQNLSFSFDDISNLIQRSDVNRGLIEDFDYDNLNRLTATTVANGYNTSVSYNELGNITFKSDVGTYVYGENGAGPHAVTSITGLIPNTYEYDANGNRIGSFDQTISYSSFNKPTVIIGDQAKISFKYGPDRRRYRMETEKRNSSGVRQAGAIPIGGGISPLKTIKRYVGTGYEQVLNGQSIINRHNIFAAGKMVAVYENENNGTNRLRYLHTDHLGSTQTISDENGAVVESLSYDAWGKRRDENWLPPTDNLMSTVDYGFTGHEHLDKVGLIHMNGRVYDPLIGRFLSADPHIQAPENLQNLNRYSYVLNNPLSYTDPSGFFFGKLFKSIGKFFSKHKNLIAGLALGVALAGLGVWVAGSSFVNGLAVGEAFGLSQAFGAIAGAGSLSLTLPGAAIAGFGLGFGSGLGSGASLTESFQAGAFAAATAGAAYQVGTIFKDYAVAKIVAHGASSGIGSVIQGGKLQHGFLSGAFTAGLGPQVNIDSSIGKIIASAVIGGTASEIGGGKFANGAITGAFIQTFNEGQHSNEKTSCFSTGRCHDGSYVASSMESSNNVTAANKIYGIIDNILSVHEKMKYAGFLDDTMDIKLFKTVSKLSGVLNIGIVVSNVPNWDFSTGKGTAFALSDAVSTIPVVGSFVGIGIQMGAEYGHHVINPLLDYYYQN